MAASSKARVQRKNQANASAHVKRKMLSAHLSDELRANEVYTKTGRVSIEGITINQADGTATERPIHASNLVITKLNTEDAWRVDSLSKNKEAKE